MENKILTIVIPTYNMDSYLDRCLNSLIITQKEDLEVIVVNDGSTDNSLKIALSFSENYPQLFKVINKKNANYGSCINCALTIATGRYIKILDADDYYDTSGLNLLVHKLKKAPFVDMILTDYTCHFLSTSVEEKMKINFIQDGVLFNTKESNNDNYSASFPFPMHSIAYRTKLLRDNNYYQTEKISYTDQEWIFFPIKDVRNLIYYSINVYNYILGREGQTVDPKIRIRNISHSLIGTRRMLDFYSKIDRTIVPKFNLCYLNQALCNRLSYIYKSILLDCNNDVNLLEDLEAIDLKLKNECPDLHRKLNTLFVHRLVPVHYVNYWRKNKKLPRKARFLYFLVRKISKYI